MQTKMNWRILIGTLLIFVTCTMHYKCIPEQSLYGCKFRFNCIENRALLCTDSYCNTMIVCNEGTSICILNVLYGPSDVWTGIIDCGYVCNSSLEHNPTYTNEIAKFCNGKQECNLEKWHAGYWTINVTYLCQGVPPTLSPSTGAITSHKSKRSTVSTCKTTRSISTDVLTTSTTTTSSDIFPTTTLAASVTSGILLFVIALVVIIYIKRRKANKQDTYNTNETTKTRDHEPDGGYGQEYEYDVTHTATNTTNDNEYNTLNETSKPLKADPNYYHIVKQSSAVKRTFNETNENVYNSLNENTNCSYSNDDANYDHVSKPSPLIGETYSQVNSDNSEGPDADTYSHLKQ